MILQSVRRPPLQRRLAPLQPSRTSLLRPAPLSAPAVFVGTVDATRDPKKPAPRTMAEAFGQHASTALRYPESTDERATRSHQFATIASAFTGVCVVIALIIEPFVK